MGQLCQDKEQGKEVGEPEIVGSDGGVLLGLEFALINKTTGRFALQLGSDVSCAMDPAVGSEKRYGENRVKNTVKIGLTYNTYDFIMVVGYLHW